MLSSLLIFFCFLNPAHAKGVRADWSYAEKRLKAEGFKKSFIRDLKKNYETKDFSQVVELNLLLFLKKNDYHGVQINAKSVKDVKKFMDKNQSILQKTEKDHGVSASAIASLLWVESRYGKNLGRFHVPSAYVHLVQAERPEVVAHLHRQAGRFTKTVSQATFREITKRTRKKAAWAIDELRAVQTMQASDGKTLKTLRGSFAGAFGMPQFIPSSFVHWARPYKKGSVPNLVNSSDAVYSVGYYLSDSGWKRGQEKTYVPALLRYNNSTDYANAILKLASRVDSLPQRGPTAEENFQIPERDYLGEDPLNEQD